MPLVTEDVEIVTNIDETKRLAIALMEALNREGAGPADGICALILSFKAAAAQAMQVPSTEAARVKNREVLFKMLADVRADLEQVDLSNAASEETMNRLKTEMIRRQAAKVGWGKTAKVEVMH